MNTPWWGEPSSGSNPIDPTLRRIALLFRILGWAWMMLLVIIGLSSPSGSSAHIEQKWVAVTTLSVATAWTGATVWAARDDRKLRSRWFVGVDFLTAFLVGGTSPGAGTSELFHGGYPMSSVVVAANGGGLRWALPISLVLGVEQFFVRLAVLDRGMSASAFSIAFPFIAVIAGWGFDALREHSAKRSEAETKLARVEAEQARLEERAELATRLHDSVLQTLNAIQLEAHDPEQVTYLARRQQRELKRIIEQFLSPHEQSFRVALLEARDDIEDMHPRVMIDALIKDDLPLDDTLFHVVEGAREAMVNAARHSGGDLIDVYSERREGSVVVMVRDRGSGFDPDLAMRAGGHGMAMSLFDRVGSVGGTVDIASRPGEGTEVVIRVDYPSGGT